jgi:hypothetical protein
MTQPYKKQETCLYIYIDVYIYIYKYKNPKPTKTKSITTIYNNAYKDQPHIHHSKKENHLHNCRSHLSFVYTVSYDNTTLLLNTLNVLHIHHKRSLTTKTSHRPNEVDLK